VKLTTIRNSRKGAVHKRCPQSEGRRFVQCGHFSDKGEEVLQMRTSALFGTKNFGFFEIYGVSAGTREVEPVLTFCGQGGRRVNFRDFVRTFFMDGFLCRVYTYRFDNQVLNEKLV